MVLSLPAPPPRPPSGSLALSQLLQKDAAMSLDIVMDFFYLIFISFNITCGGCGDRPQHQHRFLGSSYLVALCL
jgi:hypothetical protein